MAGAVLAELGSEFWKGDMWLLSVVREDGAQICELQFSGSVA